MRNHSEATAPVILLIDDDEAVRLSFRCKLEESGFSVLEAENGRLGLELFHSYNPDMVLSDLSMPEVDGLTVLKEVKENSPDTPVIMISGAGLITDVIEALRLGAWDYLMKPLQSLSELTHAVRQNMERCRLLQENKAYQHQLEESLQQIRDGEEAGRMIQRKLLPPQKQKLGEFTFRHYFMASQYLSGDFIDFFQLDHDHIIFYTADVSGHGVASSLLTVYLKSFMRQQAEEFTQHHNPLILQPDRLLSTLNEQLINEDTGKHLTLFYGVLCTGTNRLKFAGAGQFPPAFLQQDGAVEELQTKDTVVGLFPLAEYSVFDIELKERFFLTVFSDGILELCPGNTLDDKINFLKQLESLPQTERFLTALGKKDFSDDVTVLAIKRGNSDD